MISALAFGGIHVMDSLFTAQYSDLIYIIVYGGIGLVNAAIYNGDVLTYYALFGLLMIPIGKLPNRWVWVIAALLFIQPLELWQYFSGHTLSIRGIEGMETLYPTLATGTFAESARVSLLYGPLSSFGWGLEHGRGTQTLLMFVLGMLAGRYRLFYDEGQHRRIWGGLLAVGIAGTWLVPFEAMRNLMTATAIVSTVVLLWYGWPGFRRALHGMTFFGRMSLTNYLLQSLLGTALFYNWGMGLYRHVDVIYGTLAGVGIILGPLLCDRSKPELKRLSMKAPAILHRAGVKFALMTDHGVIPEQYLPVEAGLCVREGLPEMEALRAITINAAEVIGLADRIGSLAPGKDADLALFDGHPLETRTHTSLVLVGGEVAYERN